MALHNALNKYKTVFFVFFNQNISSRIWNINYKIAFIIFLKLVLKKIDKVFKHHIDAIIDIWTIEVKEV